MCLGNCFINLLFLTSPAIVMEQLHLPIDKIFALDSERSTFLEYLMSFLQVEFGAKR